MKDRQSIWWWTLHVVHNTVAHPLLVVAEAADAVGHFLFKRRHVTSSLVLLKVTEVLHKFHDVTIADGDQMNVVLLATDSQGCDLSPSAWYYCTREKGHLGPCAAAPMFKN